MPSFAVHLIRYSPCGSLAISIPVLLQLPAGPHGDELRLRTVRMWLGGQQRSYDPRAHANRIYGEMRSSALVSIRASVGGEIWVSSHVFQQQMYIPGGGLRQL